MRKKILHVSAFFVILAVLFYYMQRGNKDTIIVSSKIETSKNKKTENITVITNRGSFVCRKQADGEDFRFCDIEYLTEEKFCSITKMKAYTILERKDT